jgi:hypothetical protein
MAEERGWKHWELRGGEKPEQAVTPSASFCSHTLDLSGGEDKLFAAFDPAVRRAIRKADRHGLAATVRTDRDAVLAYYRLHVRTRRRHGLPPQPLKYFLNIHAEIIAPGLGSVVLVSKGKEPVAGAVFFHLGSRALYKFGACDERLQELRANNLAMWTGIRSLSNTGFTSLDFGRTSPHQEGLRKYKIGWGATESVAHYYRPGTGKKSSSRGPASGILTALFSRLPLSVNRLLGGILYPHLD